jgi:hypothetical protein
MRGRLWAWVLVMARMGMLGLRIVELFELWEWQLVRYLCRGDRQCYQLVIHLLLQKAGSAHATGLSHVHWLYHGVLLQTASKTSLYENDSGHMVYQWLVTGDGHGQVRTDHTKKLSSFIHNLHALIHGCPYHCTVGSMQDVVKMVVRVSRSPISCCTSLLSLCREPKSPPNYSRLRYEAPWACPLASNG